MDYTKILEELGFVAFSHNTRTLSRPRAGHFFIQHDQNTGMSRTVAYGRGRKTYQKSEAVDLTKYGFKIMKQSEPNIRQPKGSHEVWPH